MTQLVVVGDALLDRDLDGRVERLCPEAPVAVLDAIAERARPGGAALAASLAAADGLDVRLVTALSSDGAGRELAALLEGANVRVVDLGLAGPTPMKVRLRCDEQLLLRVDHGSGPAGIGAMTPEALEAIAGADAVLVSDYGRGITAEPSVRRALAHADIVVWDPHPRGALPTAGCALTTPNLREAGADRRSAESRARRLRDEWAAAAVAVTMGADGALLVGEGPALEIPAAPVGGGDPCGAGDRFAATAAERLAAGESLVSAVVAAVASASTFVAAGGAGAFRPSHPVGRAAADDDAATLAARVRARGGKVVATGGCFDLLHAGHVGMLTAARALGDCLVVCLNSDGSVRRLKGLRRPLVPQADRAAVLAALGCVDQVVIFHEDTPEQVLERIRPNIWAKGGDYQSASLPEERVLRRWGGTAVILPYIDGHSTTRLIEEASERA